MPGGPWSKAPGPLAPLPPSVGIANCAWRRDPSRAKIAVGRRRYDDANATDSEAPEGTMPTRWWSPSRGHCVRLCGPWPRRSRCLHRARPFNIHRPLSLGFAWASAETQPRCGGTLDGVKRLQQTLVSGARQAPDGGQEGGSQPTESSRSNRRLFLAPALPMDAV
jgi:hypothetical protein